MLFGICFHEDHAGEIVSHVTADTLEDLISEFEADGIDFDECLENRQIIIIEGNCIELVKTWTINRDE
jgi:hypothetical protein